MEVRIREPLPTIVEIEKQTSPMLTIDAQRRQQSATRQSVREDVPDRSKSLSVLYREADGLKYESEVRDMKGTLEKPPRSEEAAQN